MLLLGSPVRLFRWPWPLFRLLTLPLGKASKERAEIAQRLLDTDRSALENSAAKIRGRCTHDLVKCARTGCLETGTQLHALLINIAMNLKLDSGSLESLNSMIKSNMALAPAMSLELLSSRVCSRKVCTMLTGTTGSRVRDVKPVLEKLASSCMLYHGAESEILQDSFRWSPPAPISVGAANEPLVYEPGMSLSVQQKWAVKFHSKLMKVLKTSRKLAESTSSKKLCMGLRLSWDDANAVHEVHVPKSFMIAELTGRVCQLIALEHAPSSANGYHYLPAIAFQNMLDVLASLHDMLKES